LTLRASAYDAVVIGGGHNGLVCAAYLARAGLSVVVVEGRDALGGMAETREIWPGVRVSVLAHTCGRLKPQVVRDLRLRDHGLRLVQPDVRVFAPQPDGGSITLRSDIALTANGLAMNELVGPKDAAAYRVADQRLRALAAALAQLNARVPPDLATPRLADALGGVRTAIAARTRTRALGDGLLRTMPMSVRDLVDEWFESDALRAVIASRAVLLSGLGARMPGSAGALIADGAGNAGGLAGQTVFARGGPGAVTSAIESAAKSLGADFRLGVRVAVVRRVGERAVGVELADGSQIDARVVVSSLDPKTTLLSLLEPEAIGPRLSWRASNIRQRGMTAKVNFALRALPHFSAAADDARKLRGRILLAPSMRALDEAARPAKYGEISGEPLIEATIPTLADPGLVDTARAGTVRHVLSAIVQWIPAGATGDVGEIATRTIEKYAPGFADLVEECQMITPDDIERDYGAVGGHPMHAEVGLDQWFEWRPLHGFGRYRMPLQGMYLAGSGAHPGGGITGAPGQLAAGQVLADIGGGIITVRP
jgi:phytoene dehydrogenase-like protein